MYYTAHTFGTLLVPVHQWRYSSQWEAVCQMGDGNTRRSGSRHAQQMQRWEQKNAIGLRGVLDPAVARAWVSNSESWPREGDEDLRSPVVPDVTVWFWAYAGSPLRIILFGGKHASQEAEGPELVGRRQELEKHWSTEWAMCLWQSHFSSCGLVFLLRNWKC